MSFGLWLNCRRGGTGSRRRGRKGRRRWTRSNSWSPGEGLRRGGTNRYLLEVVSNGGVQRTVRCAATAAVVAAVVVVRDGEPWCRGCCCCCCCRSGSIAGRGSFRCRDTRQWSKSVAPSSSRGRSLGALAALLAPDIRIRLRSACRIPNRRMLSSRREDCKTRIDFRGLDRIRLV